MADSDKRFVYTRDDGSICIVTPVINCGLSLEEIKERSCPNDRTVYTIYKSAIPTDRTFRDAWTYTE